MSERTLTRVVISCPNCETSFAVTMGAGLAETGSAPVLPISELREGPGSNCTAEPPSDTGRSQLQRWEMHEAPGFEGRLFPLGEIRDLIRKNNLCRNDRVRRDGQRHWEWAGSVEEFKRYFELRDYVTALRATTVSGVRT